jgi:DNA (cytosine-5)-methyltransferase 1
MVTATQRRKRKGIATPVAPKLLDVVLPDVIRASDLFAGAGGSANGIVEACTEFGLTLRMSAVNHNPTSIATHTINHPNVTHHVADVDKLQFGDLCDEGVLDILWVSPSCSEHSYAKGGASIDDQQRVSAWAVVREVERYHPKIVIVENVRNMRAWSPTEIVRTTNGAPKLDKNGQPMRRPIKGRKGEIFDAWQAAIEAQGYESSYELINAADMGEAQSRLRLFIVFVTTGYKFVFPAPSHGKPGTLEVTQGLRKPWVGAEAITDFSLPMTSIFSRKPFTGNTMTRIVDAIARHCEPTAAKALFTVLQRYHDIQNFPAAARAIIEATMSNAATGTDTHPFTLGQHGGGVARSITEPLSTITCAGYTRLFTPVVIDLCHGKRARRPRSVIEPLLTITTKNGKALLVGEAQRAKEGVDPRRIVELNGTAYAVDLLFRMYAPSELARAQGFPKTYRFIGGKAAITAQIGNAVPRRVARALMRQALLALYGERRAAA